ncbi:Per1-like protein [Boletus reticuloceps]|uniref:Post-GPI attachment to proteins factor 3 n=1 Tax=Boletus reticuloceps TaxID=495285 RepID=A0A8I3AAL0_9AGAM|nr:Per1-like protein [Boletus reticuloceps]
MKAFLFSTCILVLSVSTAYGSSGDRSTEFQNCVSTCYGDHCHPWTTLPLDLRLTRWTCTDDCKYRCMHMLTDKAISLGHDIQQYYGKWPFWRFLGMQEPASVAFSLWNMWFHLQGAHQIRRKISASHPFRGYYLTWAYVSVNAWIGSTIFHTRDLPLTEKLDYFSAALAILYPLYYTVIRMANWYPQPVKPDGSGRSFLRFGWSALCIIVYLSHVTYLSVLPRFDYSYNMTFNLILGISHNILWLFYSLPIPIFQRFPYASKTYYPRHIYKAGIFVLLTTVATALELFDFPPLGRVLDAHALWHLSTAPIAKFWYDFLVEDSQDRGWQSNQH